MIGSTLGPYQIVSKLGSGGMGEVYRARDPRLGRDVAIKVLPALYSRDPDRLRRLEQEAQSASALNHPGILTVHDFGEHEGAPYIVTELLEGQTLRERMGPPALPVRKALDYASQMARALAAAHAKGIVHRDLKPENVFVTRDGHVKILDFGLAKLVQPETTDSHAAETRTIGTEPGTILGTVGYMSPEQVRGQTIDHRSDIFSLGAILYEMLAGERAFQGDSPVETMSAILKEEPKALAQSSARIPAHIARVLSHCLEKDPSERFQSARDIAFHLDGMSDVDSAAVRTAPPASPHRRRRWMEALAAALLAVVALTAGFVGGRSRTTPAADRTVSVHRLTELRGLEETPAISPDGKSVAFTAYVGDKRQIWVRLVTGGAALQVTRDDANHEAPRWAPDGSALLYYSPPAGDSQGTLWEVPPLGGSPRRVADSIGGGDISHDGKRVAFFRFADDQIELVVAARDGSEARAIANLPLGQYYLSPRWSPNDAQIAFQRGFVFTHDVFAVPATGGEVRQITREANLLSGFAWTADGSGIVFSSARGSTVLYLPTFNLWSTTLARNELRQLTFGEASYVEPDIDATGVLVASRIQRDLNIWKFPVDGTPQHNVARGVQITRQTGQVQTPSIGANDQEIVYLSDSGGHGNLWVVEADTGATRQITFEQDPAVGVGVPVWSPDGRHIAFYSTRNGVGGNLLVNPDGGNLRQVIPNGGWAAWSPDSRWLYYNENVQSTSAIGALKKIRPEGGDPVGVRDDKGNRSALSPDGSTLYYVIERPAVSGGADYEIRAASPETAPSRVLARIPAQRIPLWQLIHPVVSPDGKWLALPLTDGFSTNIWTLATAGGEMRQLTEFGDRPTYIARRVAWSTDGKWIVAALGQGDADIVLLRGVL
ncbi:MAG TPA: protein kinase [Vicinamibacterales bacterium]|nr:protein kinase [Vicinamibacterales bacterium]